MTLFYKLKRIRWTSRIFVITPIISLCLLFTHEKPLAANFNVKKSTLSDLETLEKRRVPRDFPHYATNLTQSCETSEGENGEIASARVGLTTFFGDRIFGVVELDYLKANAKIEMYLAFECHTPQKHQELVEIN